MRNHEVLSLERLFVYRRSWPSLFYGSRFLEGPSLQHPHPFWNTKFIMFPLRLPSPPRRPCPASRVWAPLYIEAVPASNF